MVFFYLPCWVNTYLAQFLNRFLNGKSVVAIFNKEKALIGAFFMIVKTEESFAALFESAAAGLSLTDCGVIARVLAGNGEGER